MIRAIIFDCFGVLVGGGFKETYRQAGGDPLKDRAFITEILDNASMGLITSAEMSRQITRQLGISDQVWQEVVAGADKPNEELFEYIKQLAGEYRLAILSNANTGVLNRKLSPEQLSLFDAVVVSADVGMTKPDLDIYTYTADQLGVQSGECVFIDDSEGYCEAARSLGMQAVHYQDLSHLKAELQLLLRHL